MKTSSLLVDINTTVLSWFSKKKVMTLYNKMVIEKIFGSLLDDLNNL